MPDLIAIFCATKEELRIFRAKMQVRRISLYPDCRVWQGRFHSKDCLLVQTGMGQIKTQQAAARVMSAYSLELVISTGLGGALKDETRVGDIVIFSRLKNALDQGKSGEEADLICDWNLVSRAVDCMTGTPFKLMTGTGVTTTEICVTPESKRRLGIDSKADLVDMESYVIGRLAAARGIPFLGFRSIFDALDDDLTPLSRLASEDKNVPWRVVRQLFLTPGLAKELLQYYRNYRLAARSLEQFTGNLMDTI